MATNKSTLKTAPKETPKDSESSAERPAQIYCLGQRINEAADDLQKLSELLDNRRERPSGDMDSVLSSYSMLIEDLSGYLKGISEKLSQLYRSTPA